MLSLYFYIVTGFAASFLTRSPAKSMAIFLLFQFAFLMPIFGTGLLTILEFCTYYTLAYFCVSIIGWMLALVLNVPSVFMNRRIDVSDGCCKEEHCPRDGEGKMAFTKRKLIATGESNGRSRKMKIGALVYRIFFGSLFIMMFAASTLPYELIPAPSQWVGMLLSILCLIVVHIIFYFVFRFVPADAKARGISKLAPFKSVQAVYLSLFHGKWVDMTVDVVLYLAIFYVPITLAFCCTSIWAPWWWQFWTCLIICGVYFVFFLIAGLTWLKFDCDPIVTCPTPKKLETCVSAMHGSN